MSDFVNLKDQQVYLPEQVRSGIITRQDTPIFTNFMEDKIMGVCNIEYRDGKYYANGKIRHHLKCLLDTGGYVLGSSVGDNGEVATILSVSITPAGEAVNHIHNKPNMAQIEAHAQNLGEAMAKLGVSAKDASETMRHAINCIPQEVWDVLDAEIERRGI